MGDASLEVFKSEPLGFSITLSVVSVICGVLIPLFFKDKPSSPSSASQAQKDNGAPFSFRAESRSLAYEPGFVLASIASAMFIAYTVDVSKGLANLIRLGDESIQDLEGITLFFYVPGLFSTMLPALYLGRGIMMYRSIFCIIMIASFLGKTSKYDHF